MIHTLALCMVLVLSSPTHYISHENPDISYAKTAVVKVNMEPIDIAIKPDVVAVEKFIVAEAEEPEITMSEEDIELIALVTMAEAEGECEDGKRLVIDTILNRVDSDIPYFPDTVSEVIYQKNAFESISNGRVDKCYVDNDICQLVREELMSRTNYDVMYFSSGGYGKYGTPMFSVDNHYFSSN